MCSLSDFRLARSRSLSVGAWLPSAAPDSARALDWAAADFCSANSVGGGGRAIGSASPPAGWQHRGEGSPPCALSQISGWRDRGLYPLARGCRAPRRILPEPWTGRLPISVWRIRLAAAAELSGQRRRRRAGNTAVRGLRRVLSLRFQAGAIAVFIRWRVAAERRAGFCPSLGLGGCRFLFGEFGWRRRPSYRVSVAAGGLATPR